MQFKTTLPHLGAGMVDEGYFLDERKETEKADVHFKTKTPHEDCPVEALAREVLLHLIGGSFKIK